MAFWETLKFSIWVLQMYTFIFGLVTAVVVVLGVDVVVRVE